MKICNIVRLRLLHALVDILNRKRLYTDKNSNKEDEASLIKKRRLLWCITVEKSLYRFIFSLTDTPAYTL